MPGWTGAVTAALVIAPACDRPEADVAVRAERAVDAGGTSPSAAPAPRRTAAEAEDLRALLAAVTGARACDRVEGMFRGLPARSGEPVIEGVLWFDGCTARADGVDVAFELTGRGWQWVQARSESAGAAFEVEQYVRFEARVDMRGPMDAAYDPDAHVATIYFTPERTPSITADALGDIQVDEEGAWSEIVGTVAGLVSTGPEGRAGQRVERGAAGALRERLSEGFAATVDLCSGRVEAGLGHPRQGEMMGGDGGGASWTDVRLRPDGLVLDGPHPAGTTFELEADGPVDAAVVCHDSAATLARAFLAQDPLPRVAAVRRARVAGEPVALRSSGAGCEVVLATTPATGAGASYRVRVDAPPAVTEPLADCDRPR